MTMQKRLSAEIAEMQPSDLPVFFLGSFYETAAAERVLWPPEGTSIIYLASAVCGTLLRQRQLVMGANDDQRKYDEGNEEPVSLLRDEVCGERTIAGHLFQGEVRDPELFAKTVIFWEGFFPRRPKQYMVRRTARLIFERLHHLQPPSLRDASHYLQLSTRLDEHLYLLYLTARKNDWFDYDADRPLPNLDITAEEIDTEWAVFQENFNGC